MEVLQIIKPAICFKEEIEKALAEYFYSEEMFLYWGGSLEDYLLTVSTCSDNGRIQLAVLDDDENLIGYIGYIVDYYSSSAAHFGAFSFDKGNPIMGKELFNLFEKLLKTMHRVEFRAIQGNPAIRGYDHFLQKHKDIGKKHIFTDSLKDREGKYRDSYVYEFVNK